MEDTDQQGPIKKMRRNRRSRPDIEKELFDTITRVIAEQGFGALAINCISGCAKVDKNIIYKYFGSFDTLLENYFLQNDYWVNFVFRKTTLNEGRFDVFFREMLKELFETFDRNLIFQNLIRWEVAEPRDFIKRHAKWREIGHRELLDKNVGLFKQSGLDIEAFYALCVAGIYYLILRKEVSTFFSIDVNTKEGKNRILKAIGQIADMIFQTSESIDYKKRIALKLLQKNMPVPEIAEITELSEEVILWYKNE